MRPVVKSDSQANFVSAPDSLVSPTVPETVTYANPLVDEEDDSNAGLPDAALDNDIAKDKAAADVEDDETADSLASLSKASLPSDRRQSEDPPSVIRVVRPRTTSESCDAEVSQVPEEDQRLQQQQQQQQQPQHKQPLSVADYFADLQTEVGFLDVGSDEGAGSAAVAAAAGEPEADLFTDSIRSGEAERRMDAWLPLEATRQLLDSVVAGKLDPTKVDASQLTRPSLQHLQQQQQQQQPNPMRDLLVRFCGESIARGCAPNADSVPQDATGAAQLFRTGCYRACLDLLARLLLQHHQQQLQHPHQQHSPASLRLWFARLSLLLRTRQSQIAEVELAPFRSLDGPDLYYEFYPGLYPGRRGSMVPFGMRLLHAELGGAGALARLYFLVAVIDRMLCNLRAGLSEAGLDLPPMSPEQRSASVDLWQRRKAAVLYSVANNLTTVARDHAAAARVYGQLLALDPANSERIWAALGRLSMQVGDLQSARHHLGRCAQSAPPERRDFYAAQLAVSSADWPTAQRLLRSALEANPNNILAANNLAVISLYTGQLREAIRLLESLLEREPRLAIHEGLVFNLCTMYDLESSKAVGKKTRLLETVARHRGDNFDVAAFKF